MDEDAERRLPVLGRAPELVGVDPWFTPDEAAIRAVLAEAVDPAAETEAAS